jgi:starch-binding outer membrane protein, SusD/RagB family
MKYSIHKSLLPCFLAIMVIFMPSCKKYIEVNPPFTTTNAANVYESDGTAASVLSGIYANISKLNLTSGGITSISLFSGLSADEFTLFNPPSQSNLVYNAYYTNLLTSSSVLSVDFWSNIYSIVFVANSAIEGLSNSKGLTLEVKQQLLGEAKFIRALCYFYLINLYGDVPLVVSTNYEVNRALPRTSAGEVWAQIIQDLKDAQGLLSESYKDGSIVNSTLERATPNKWAATSLLARSYLYTKDYINAEIQSTAVINNKVMYDTVALNSVFIKNNKEAIWQLQPVVSNPTNTWDARLFVLQSSGPNTNNYPVFLSNYIVNSFEADDKRKTVWINKVVVGGNTYWYPYKYKIFASGAAVSEYNTVLRIGEQYLIRAEARTQLGNLSEAINDLNVIRRRAGLANITADSQSKLLIAIMQERKVELFTEYGHRWFDLKRTNTIDAVMESITPQKGGNWNANWALYPIPQLEIERNPSLVGNQNPGY